MPNLEGRDHCGIFGPSSVPWCRELHNAPVPEGYLNREAQGAQLEIPLALIGTGTPHKFETWKKAMAIVTAQAPGLVHVDQAIKYEPLPVMEEESDYMRGKDVVEEKANRLIDWFWKTYGAPEAVVGSHCFTQGACWRFPWFFFSDVKVRVSETGNPNKERVHKLATELKIAGGAEWQKKFSRVEDMSGYLFQRFRQLFSEGSNALIDITTGNAVVRIVDGNGNKQLAKEEILMRSGEASLNYSMPSKILTHPPFLRHYLETIAKERGNLLGVTATPLGLYAERVLQMVYDENLMESVGLDRNLWREVTYKPLQSAFGLSPEEQIEMVALGWSPSVLYDILKDIANEKSSMNFPIAREGREIVGAALGWLRRIGTPAQE